jgi:hypothetical protein
MSTDATAGFVADVCRVLGGHADCSKCAAMSLGMNRVREA